MFGGKTCHRFSPYWKLTDLCLVALSQTQTVIAHVSHHRAMACELREGPCGPRARALKMQKKFSPTSTHGRDL